MDSYHNSRSIFAPLRNAVPPRVADIEAVQQSFDSDQESQHAVLDLTLSDNTDSHDNISEHYNNEINSDTDSYSDSDDWDFPTPDDVSQEINQLENLNPNKLAWQALLEHDDENSKAHVDWYPWRNELCMLLFLCRYDPTYGMTRNIIQCFLDILRTMKKNGHITANYFIPKDASTVEKWWKFIPKPPIRMLLLF